MRLGLRGEILATFGLITLFAIVLNTLVVWQLDTLLVRRERVEQISLAGTLAGSALGRAPVKGDAARITADVPRLISLSLYDTQGRSVDHWGPALSEPDPSQLIEALRLGETQAVATPAVSDQHVLRVTAPVGARGAPTGVMVAWVGASSASEVRRAREPVFLYVALDALLAGLFGWYLVNRQIIRPLSRLTEATRKVAEGEVRTKVPVGGDNELGGIARDFNRMTEALGEREAKIARQIAELKSANEALHAARE